MMHRLRKTLRLRGTNRTDGPFWFALLFVLACLPCTARSAAAAAAPKARTLRCLWQDPCTRRPLCFDFPAPPILFVQPESEIRCWLLEAGHPVMLTGVVEAGSGLEALRRRELDCPSVGLRFAAPRGKGAVELHLRTRSQDHAFRLVCFVPHRAGGGTTTHPELLVEGESLGPYGEPQKSRIRRVAEQASAYRPPRWFGEVLPAETTLLVTPHWSLAECVIPTEKTGKRHTPYFPIVYPTWSNFERLRSVLAAGGVPVTALRILSTFRSPAYNRQIGSSRFSRHPYGDAIDFFFDGDDNGVADDLTGDGRVDRRDALHVIHLIEAAQHAGRLATGGIGCYYFPYVTRAHRLTFHIDFRGHRATWGYQYGRRGRRAAFAWQSRYFAEADRRRRERYR